jgi:hypothetical protein
MALTNFIKLYFIVLNFLKRFYNLLNGISAYQTASTH